MGFDNFFQVHNISERHWLLSRSIGTRPEENVSYWNAQVILLTVLVFFIVGSALEVTAYLLFNNKVLTSPVLVVCVYLHYYPRFTPGRTC